MGCDIHLYIECRKKKADGTFGQWHPGIFGGEFLGSRNYDMFAYIGGVRGEIGQERIVPERGLPEDVSRYVEECTCCPILSDEKDYAYWFESTNRPVTRENADKWVKEGIRRKWKHNTDYIYDPSKHSHNWCTTKELAKCIRKCENGELGVGYDWYLLLDHMKSYEKRGFEVRAVF
ncbi:MAG: hypothetical protein J6Y37_15710, partial [Paludibacteraceae bacterium]|nr:hypothetical protein [Paludibacteraceae bacterium]